MTERPQADEPVRLTPSDPTWPDLFELERAALEEAIGEWVEGGIHHVGSTAVPGLEAKPIIDILVGVRDLESARACFAPLAGLGYLYAPYLPEEMHWFCKPDPARRTHHLHLVPANSRRFRDELAFRDLLRADPQLAADYAALKRDLAGRHRDDREAYTDAKGAFIRAALGREGRPVMSEEPDRGPARRFIAAARRFNREPRLVRAARNTRERTLGDDRFVDHLSTARGRPSDLAAQQLVALRGDTHGVLGELGLTALQAWQRLAESQDRGRGKVDVAILFTDLAGFSTWALEAGDRAAIRLLREVAAAIEPPVAEQRGEVVKRLGDGLMAAFWDAPRAVEAAFTAAERAASVEVEGHRPELRSGIHLGRPRKVGGDYFGVDVNIAARLAEAAKPGELLVSNHTLERLEPGAVSAKKRRFSAKGTPAELSAYALTRPA